MRGMTSAFGRGDRLLQGFGHEDAAGAGRITRDRSERTVAMPLVEAWCLEADRVQHGRGAAPPPRFVLGGRQDPAPQLLAAQRVRHIEEVDEENTERRAPEQAADHLLGRRIGHQDGEIA